MVRMRTFFSYHSPENKKADPCGSASRFTAYQTTDAVYNSAEYNYPPESGRLSTLSLTG